jgi:molybdopterin molybdotransferase
MTTAPRQLSVRPARHRGGTAWPKARLLAAQATPLPAQDVPLVDALGCVLAADLKALGDLPAADNSAMDGWAVAGSPPWRVMADLPAGGLYADRLRAGQCVRIATGATVPDGTDAVIPVEESMGTTSGVRPAAVGSPESRRLRSHIRRAGEEATCGDILLPAGTLVTPPILGLAAAAGNDTLLVVPNASIDVFILGDELLDGGVSGVGRTRDALGPQLPGWLLGFAVAPRTVRRVPDDLPALAATLAASDADVLVTTGGTSVGPRDHVRAAVEQVGGHLVVPSVDVKPGHPMLLASLPGDRWLVGLPGNPLAACVTMLTLIEPLLTALHGRQHRPHETVRLVTAQPGRFGDGHRLLPVALASDGSAAVLPSCGSAMLRGLAAASGLAVINPSGAEAGQQVSYLRLPWSQVLIASSQVNEPTSEGAWKP